MIAPALCCALLQTEHCLLWHQAKSISSIVLLFDVRPYNLGSHQIPPLWGYSTATPLCSVGLGISFSPKWKEKDAQLTAPLTCGIIKGLVPSGSQGLYCNPEREREREWAGDSLSSVTSICVCRILENAMNISLDSAHWGEGMDWAVRGCGTDLILEKSPDGAVHNVDMLSGSGN